MQVATITVNILCLVFCKLLLLNSRSTFLFCISKPKLSRAIDQAFSGRLLTPEVGDWTQAYSFRIFGELLSVVLCSPVTVIPLMRHIHSRPTTISVLKSVVEWKNANMFNTSVLNY